jgi:hypothetical protein
MRTLTAVLLALLLGACSFYFGTDDDNLMSAPDAQLLDGTPSFPDAAPPYFPDGGSFFPDAQPFTPDAVPWYPDAGSFFPDAAPWPSPDASPVTPDAAFCCDAWL